MRILFALPGFHAVNRGAEVALGAVARELAAAGDDVTLIGGGPERPGEPYRYVRAKMVRRERFEAFPRIPLFRNEFVYEEATFLPGFLQAYDPSAYDAVITCSFPFVHWALRRRSRSGYRPTHLFVTQNGDWPALSNRLEYNFFDCDGLVCINPDYFERNKEDYACALIPNGVDLDRFAPGRGDRRQLGLPMGAPIVLMVSALTPYKRVDLGIEAVAETPGAFLLVAGDGPERGRIEALAARKLPGRFRRMTLTPAQMPMLYGSVDAFLHLAQDEPFGNVYLEAMACGLPIVSQDTPRLRWIVGERPSLFRDDTCDAIAAAITAALAQKAGAPVDVGITRFSWAEIARQYREFIVRLRSDSG